MKKPSHLPKYPKAPDGFRFKYVGTGYKGTTGYYTDGRYWIQCFGSPLGSVGDHYAILVPLSIRKKKKNIDQTILKNLPPVVDKTVEALKEFKLPSLPPIPAGYSHWEYMGTGDKFEHVADGTPLGQAFGDSEYTKPSTHWYVKQTTESGFKKEAFHDNIHIIKAIKKPYTESALAKTFMKYSSILSVKLIQEIIETYESFKN